MTPPRIADVQRWTDAIQREHHERDALLTRLPDVLPPHAPTADVAALRALADDHLFDDALLELRVAWERLGLLDDAPRLAHWDRSMSECQNTIAFLRSLLADAER